MIFEKVMGLLIIGVLLSSLYYVSETMVNLNDGRVEGMVEGMVR